MSEEEVYVFLGSLTNTLTTCDSNMLEKMILPSASVKFTSNYHPMDAMTGKEYWGVFQKHCEPYISYKWDSSQNSVSIQSAQATVRSNLFWGAQAGKGSSVRIDQEVAIVQQRDGSFAISRIVEHVHELLSGGEDAYFARFRDQSLLTGAVHWYHGMIDLAQDLFSKRQKGFVR